MRAAAVVAALLGPAPAWAHVFAQPYALPVPFSLYAFGAAAALVLSFLAIGMFVTLPQVGRVPKQEPAARVERHGRLVRAGRVASALLLLLCIATGLFGTPNAFVNFNMTFFWIVFVLGVPYATAFVGDFYAAINPWRAIVEFIERFAGISCAGRVRYPAGLAYAPAVLFYVAFIWIELYANLGPFGLSVALAGYTALNVLGAWLVGKTPWFEHAEFFGVFLRLVGRLSPWSRTWNGTRTWSGSRSWRPLSGLTEGDAGHVSLVVFIVFMLSSTAVDGLHSTTPWVDVFWRYLYPLIAPWFSPPKGQQYALAASLYYVWQWCMLILSPFLYLIAFYFFVWLSKLCAASKQQVGTLVRAFAFSLVPIAFVYHVSHYFSVLLAQGVQIVKLASDPFGFGWNLFGTARSQVAPFMLDVSVIWHAQVGLILAGHMAGVYLAHVEALKTFGSPRRAALSQLPMLLLMVLFTTLGLWILSLPLAPG